MDDELFEDRKAMDEDLELDIDMDAQQEAIKIVAMNVFEYNSTLTARLALGHGIDRETVAMSLRTLADAIETQDCAESMFPIDDGNTFEQTFL